MLTCALPDAGLRFTKQAQLYKDLRLALSTAEAIEEKAQKPSPLILCLVVPIKQGHLSSYCPPNQ